MLDKVTRPETPEAIYGRLLESVHISGYTMGRACTELKRLLEKDDWKMVGGGFDDIDEFARSIDLSQFKIALDERKDIAKLFAKKQASQRATAKALGVGQATIGRDLTPEPSGSKPAKAHVENPDIEPSGSPSPIQLDGKDKKPAPRGDRPEMKDHREMY